MEEAFFDAPLYREFSQFEEFGCSWPHFTDTLFFLLRTSGMPNPNPPYPVQFRGQMVELVRAGRKLGKLAKKPGGHPTSILGWVLSANEANDVVPPSSTPNGASC